MEKQFMIIFSVILFGLVACGVTNNQANDDTLIEGEMTDITDRNPNFLHLNADNGSNTNDRATYSAKIREAADQSKQFETKGVYMTGARATVTVRPLQSYTEQDVKEFEEHIQRVVPRYQIDVHVKDK